MFSFFSRGKKKVDVNSNDLPQTPTQQATNIFTPFFQVTTSVVPNASTSTNNNQNSGSTHRKSEESTQNATSIIVTPFITDADTSKPPNPTASSDGIGNGIVKMCKNKTDFSADGGGSCTAASSATKTTATTERPQHPVVGDSNDQRPHPVDVVVVKSSPTPTMSSVKPAGHGTIAISPRIPTPNASRRNSAVTPTQTPPESPRIVEIYDDCIGFPQFPTNGITNGLSSHSTKSLPEAPPRLRVNKSIANEITVTPPSSDDERYTKKNLVNQEAKFQSQLNDLSKQLVARDAEANKLRFQMEELQRDVFAKSAGMDRLQAELQAAHKESDYVKQRIKNLEQDLQDYRQKNGNLSEEITRKTELFGASEVEANQKITNLESIIHELREKIATLEAQIHDLQAEKQALVAQHASILLERDKEKKQVEQQLEESIKQKSLVQAKWQSEFEKLRTVNLLKEQSLLDDFEWKLREVHKSCKSKLDEKERSLEQRLKEAYRDAEVKMTIAQQMMDEVQYLRACKAEVQSLKGQSEEHQKAMKELIDKQADMKATEYALKEEAKKLRRLIDMEKENLQHMQRVHHQEMTDKERWLQTTLQEKKTEIAEYWEERLLHEIGRLKYELEQLYLEEKQEVVMDLKTKKEEEFELAKREWEMKIAECLKEIKMLKKTLDEKEAYYQQEMITQQTNADREIFEFRRIMDKIDNAHHERFEKLSMDHELEMEKLMAQHKDKLAEAEMSHKNQTSTLRASLILLKDQMEKEAQQQINELIAQHRSQLDTQWANLVHQKSEAIKLLEHDYVQKIRTLEEQFYTQQKSHESREIELLKTIDSLKNEIASKESTMDDMQSNVDTLEGGVQVLNQEIAQQSEQLMRNRRDADQKIRGLQDVLMKLQALADQERDEFQSKLTQQQKQSQQQIDHLQKKVLTLTKLFEEVRTRYERRESRQEDLNLIADLRQVIAEQEKDLACINEEKRYFQMQLMNMQRDNNDNSNSYSDNDEFADTDDFQPQPDDYTVTFPGDSPESKATPTIMAAPAPTPRPKLTSGTINLAIPPTIPECDDCEDEEDDS